jgi:site-specific recombinase XerD
MDEISISQAFTGYLETVAAARNANTARAYRNAIQFFAQTLTANGISPGTAKISALTEDAVTRLAAALKPYAPATEKLYLGAIVGFYKYLAAENLAPVNLPRLEMLVKMRSRPPGVRLPQFERDDIEQTLNYAQSLPSSPVDEPQRLPSLRDRAFLLTLADTGLRVHEACSLRRGDVDWNEAKAILIGKGNKQAVVRFSSRALRALKDYLDARAPLDGGSGRPLPSLPLFARHDKGAGSKVKPITTTTGRNIVKERVREALGEEKVGSITPHTFRHYFVTTVLRGSGGNLKLAQELARHQNIAVTQRYAHLADDELDQGYHGIFEGSDETP